MNESVFKIIFSDVSRDGIKTLRDIVAKTINRDFRKPEGHTDNPVFTPGKDGVNTRSPLTKSSLAAIDCCNRLLGDASGKSGAVTRTSLLNDVAYFLGSLDVGDPLYESGRTEPYRHQHYKKDNFALQAAANVVCETVSNLHYAIKGKQIDRRYFDSRESLRVLARAIMADLKAQGLDGDVPFVVKASTAEIEHAKPKLHDTYERAEHKVIVNQHLSEQSDAVVQLRDGLSIVAFLSAAIQAVPSRGKTKCAGVVAMNMLGIKESPALEGRRAEHGRIRDKLDKLIACGDDTTLNATPATQLSDDEFKKLVEVLAEMHTDEFISAAGAGNKALKPPSHSMKM